MARKTKKPQLPVWHPDRWREELAIIALVLSPFGVEIADATADYESFIVSTPSGVRLLIYPHKTQGTGNYNLRVRDTASKDIKAAFAICRALDAFGAFDLPRGGFLSSVPMNSAGREALAKRAYEGLSHGFFKREDA